MILLVPQPMRRMDAPAGHTLNDECVWLERLLYRGSLSWFERNAWGSSGQFLDGV